jgi:hypothetical protein
VLQNFTLVISGPIKSRLAEDKLKIRLNYLQNLSINHGLKVIISTYKNELPAWANKKIFKLIINDDPGIDDYRSGPWPMGQGQRNTSRMLYLTSNGISSVNTYFTIKSRIELLPNNAKFIEMCKYYELTASNYPNQILVIKENYLGVCNQEKSLLCWIPDTFQIMETKNLKAVWSTAEELWVKYKAKWHYRRKFPLTNEQILGLSFYKRYLNLPDDIIKNFYRFKYSRLIFKLNLIAESGYIRLYSFEEAGLTDSRLLKNRSVILENYNRKLNRFKKNRFNFFCRRIYVKHSINKKILLRVILNKIRYEFKKVN